ncbi:hypothetical protein ACFS7Z_26925, partial [Pontibacter toksunensis]
MKRTFTSKIYALIVLVAFTAASCGEENDDDDAVTPDPNLSGCRLTTLAFLGESGSADDDVVKIEYNAQGYISKAIEDYEEGGANSDYTRYTYDA